MEEINGASVLLLIREGKATDLDQLSAMFPSDPRSIGYTRYDVHNVLRELQAAGLVELGTESPVDESVWNHGYGIANV